MLKLPTINVAHKAARLFLLTTVLFSISAYGQPPAQAALYQSEICSAPYQSVGLPLTELGSNTYTRMDGQETTFTGGLYPGGSNTRPPAHEMAGLAAAAQIIPLDQNGQPDASRGRIGLVSIGMSNTNMEFDTFLSQANNDPQVNPHLLLINGALPNQTADRWVDPNSPAWQALDQQLSNLQVSPLQIQAAWVKLTLAGGGDFPIKAQELQSDLEIVARNLKSRFPNLRIAYYSSRIWSYTYYRGLSPEPLAFETGFAVKWMIEKQIQGHPDLNFDPAAGEVKAPFLSWGPYLWANGQTPRDDGLTWQYQDLTNDCTHPTLSGRQKVADLLMDFFKTDSTTQSWFLVNGQPPVTNTPTPTTTITLTPGTTAISQTVTQTPQTPPAITNTASISPSLTPTPGGGGSGTPVIYLTVIFGSTIIAGGLFWFHFRKMIR